MRVVAGQVEQGLGAVEQSGAEKLGLALAAGLDLSWMEDFFVAALRLDRAREEGGFNADQTAHAPLGVGDLADELPFERVLRPQVVLEIAELTVEFGGVLLGEYGVACEQPVLERVERDARFALFGAGTGGFFRGFRDLL